MSKPQPPRNRPLDILKQPELRTVVAAACSIPLIAAVILTCVLTLTAEDPFTGLVLGVFCNLVAGLPLLGLFGLSRFITVHKHQVPHRYAALILKQGKRVQIVLGPDEVTQTGEKDLKIELKDLRDRHLPIQQECTTCDNAKIKLSWVAQWCISNVERYLDGAVEPEVILEDTLRSAMLYQVARHAKKDLAGKLADIAAPIAAQVSAHMHRYGIFVQMAEITQVEIPGDPPKTPKPGEAEAERMRNLDAVIREATPRTVLHIERLNKFNQSREQETK